MPVETISPEMLDAVESIAELEPGDRTASLHCIARSFGA